MRIVGFVGLLLFVEDVFDVYRDGVKRVNMGVVEQIEFSEVSTRVLFCFPRTNPQVSEWHNLNSKSIRPFKRKSSKTKESPEVGTADVAIGGDPPDTERNVNANGLDLLLTAINGQASEPSLDVHQKPMLLSPRTSLKTADITQSFGNFSTERLSRLSLPSLSPSIDIENQVNPYRNPTHHDIGTQGLTVNVQDSRIPHETSRLVRFPEYNTPYGHNLLGLAQYGFNHIQGSGLNDIPDSQHHTNLSTFNGGDGFTPQVAFGVNATRINANILSSAVYLQPNQISLAGEQCPLILTRPNQVFPFTVSSLDWPNQYGA